MLVRLSEMSRLLRTLAIGPLSERRVSVGDNGEVKETTEWGLDRGVRKFSSLEAVGKSLGEKVTLGAGSQTSDGSRMPTPLTSRVRFRNCGSVRYRTDQIRPTFATLASVAASVTIVGCITL